MPFQKGKSGNPGGRPKAAHDVQAIARKRTLFAIKRLTEIARMNDLPAAVAACKALLDRAWGKPLQSIEKTVTHKRSPRELTLEELEAKLTESRESTH